MKRVSDELRALLAEQDQRQPWLRQRAVEFDDYGSKRIQRSPDRARSIARRRRLAASGPMPRHLAEHFTTSGMAVMSIVADEHRRKGCCALSLDEIAARAGVSRVTAKRALRQARAAQLVIIKYRPRLGRKNETNLVGIISPEWLRWLARRATRPR